MIYSPYVCISSRSAHRNLLSRSNKVTVHPIGDGQEDRETETEASQFHSNVGE